MAVQQEEIKNHLLDKIKHGEIFSFPELFTAFIFTESAAVLKYEQLLKHLKYLFEITTGALKDDLALATLKKIQTTYHIIEKELERKKEGRQQHFGDAAKRANDIFFEFVIGVYSTIIWKKKESGFDEIGKIVMQKTRFQMLEYASQQWVQEMTDESYTAFRFLVKAFESQEKKEILDQILRPRVEKWFTNVELIEEWIMSFRRDPVPYEIQRLLSMTRAKNGGPELAKQDIANSRVNPNSIIDGQKLLQLFRKEQKAHGHNGCTCKECKQE